MASTTRTIDKPSPPVPADLRRALDARRQGRDPGRESDPLRRLANALAGVRTAPRT